MGGDCEQAKCDFCQEIKIVDRFYIRVKNKHFDDNKQGRYSTFISYCSDCGIDKEEKVNKKETIKEFDSLAHAYFENKSLPMDYWAGIELGKQFIKDKLKTIKKEILEKLEDNIIYASNHKERAVLLKDIKKIYE